MSTSTAPSISSTSPMATTTIATAYSKTMLVYGGAPFQMVKTNNIPDWIFYVNSASLILCLTTFIVWLCCALCIVLKPNECNHKVLEAVVVIEKEPEMKKEPKKEKNSQRSSRRAVD